VLESERERAQITDLFGPAELKKAGREFVARCPWHDDRHPSLSVSPVVDAFYWTVLAPDIVNSVREEQGSISV
jgi:DNA primase